MSDQLAAILTGCIHKILIGFPSKHAQKIKHVEQEVLIRGRHRANELLVLLYCLWSVSEIHVAELDKSQGEEERSHPCRSRPE